MCEGDADPLLATGEARDGKNTDPGPSGLIRNTPERRSLIRWLACCASCNAAARFSERAAPEARRVDVPTAFQGFLGAVSRPGSLVILRATFPTN
jgi:hypothetical protein